MDRFFFTAPLIGLVFIGISTYYKIVNTEDIIDTINLILNIISLVIFGIGYFFLITSFFAENINRISHKKLTAYTLFAIVYYVYGIALALISIYYNIMVFLVISISIFMLLLIPGIKFIVFIGAYLSLYMSIACIQFIKLIPSAPDQISINREGGPLIVIFAIKLVILIFLNFKKYLHLHLVQLEEKYTSNDNPVDHNRSFFEIDMNNIKLSMLSKRELEVVRLLLNGLSYKEIADNLRIVHGTVQSHVKNIYRKCKVTSKNELIDLIK